ncbi:hypothetical protein L7F22_049148 [Adiantum nelumboides]|nr:hypothetical protein [Adiantum nelumboides]
MSLVDTVFSTSLVKEDDLKNKLNDEISSQLAFTSALRVLTISELSEAANFRFALEGKVSSKYDIELTETANFRLALEGKVLSKYNTCKIPKLNFNRYMQLDLLDRESRHTVTFVVIEIYLSDFVEAFAVNDYVRIEGACVKKDIGKDASLSNVSEYLLKQVSNLGFGKKVLIAWILNILVVYART